MVDWDEVFRQSGSAVLDTPELTAMGARPDDLTIAVRTGALVRVRRGVYCTPSVDTSAQRALRIGGRLGCVSALRSYGIFAIDPGTHVHIARGTSRIRSDRATLHWWPLIDASNDRLRVGVKDALAQAVRCQTDRLAVASLDNALQLRIIASADLVELFEALPARYEKLRKVIDGRSEAGQESVLRLLLREWGLRVQVQPTIPGVGRVDLLVEGRLIVEADSRAFHSGWDAQKRDRERDLAAARIGLMSIRPLYEHTMFDPDRVRAAVFGLLRSSNSSRTAAFSGFRGDFLDSGGVTR